MIKKSVLICWISRQYLKAIWDVAIIIFVKFGFRIDLDTKLKFGFSSIQSYEIDSI
jgi:hypothetical protein